MKHIFIIILTVWGSYCYGQKPHSKFNLDFEVNTSDSEISEGWVKWGDYKVNIDTISYSGKFSGYVISNEGGNSFGSIAYKIPANYNGQTIKLEGYMKTQGVENGFAGLLLRIDGKYESLAFGNMQERNINGTNDWGKYVITFPYPKAAENIIVGGILTGKGEAWFDDFVVTIDGKNIEDIKEQSKPISKADSDREFDLGSKVDLHDLNNYQIKSLELLGKIWGFLKYHHPAICKGNYNWDYELFRVLPQVLKTNNIFERNNVLLTWVEKFGKVETCETCNKTSIAPPLKSTKFWITDTKIDTKLKEELINIYENRCQGDHFYIRTIPNVGNPEFLNENPYYKMPYPDPGFRLLALYRYWNIIQYFFPNKHLTDKNWNEVLREYIPHFINAKTELEYELEIIKLIGEINDSHAIIWRGNDKISKKRGVFYPPFHVQFVEEKLVIKDFYDPSYKDSTGLEIGDIISHVNGRSIKKIIDSIMPYYPSSNKASKMRDISRDILRSNANQINIRIIREKQKKILTLYERENLSIDKWYNKNRDEYYKIMEGNIGYISLQHIRDENISLILESFKNTKGIVIDIRNYPNSFVPFSLGSYFVSTSTPFVKFTKPNINNPGEFIYTPTLEIPKAQETYKGKVLVLVNEETQSQAEYTAMALKAGQNTTIIGSKTAGANGDISQIFLPGGLQTSISGIGVYYPDGTETQRVGIIPDIEIEPTIKGIKEGRDEVLEKAVQLIDGY